MIAFLGVIGVTMFYGTTLGVCRKFGLLKLDGTLNCFGLLISDGTLFMDELFFVMILDLYYDKLSSSLTCISIIPSLFVPVPFTVPQILSPHVLPSSK